MNLNEYALWTDKTAMYPNIHEPHYLALGVVEETGEFVNAMKAGKPSDVMKEAGDVLWYAARYVRLVLNRDFEDFVQAACQNHSADSEIDPMQTHIAMAQLAGCEKKRLRDGETWDKEKRCAKEAEAAKGLLTIIAFVLNTALMWHHISLDRIIEENVAKLTGRKEAGTIQGDGDHR